MGGVVSKVTDAVGLTDNKGAKELAGQSMASMREAAARLEKVNLPEVEKMKLLLENPQLVEMLQAEEMAPSAMGEIQVDPRLREAEMSALEMLKQRGEQGLTEEDRIVFRQMQDQVAGDEQARQASILANMQQSGMADSGTSLAAQLSSNQAAAQRQSQQAAEMARAALESKRNALSQAGNMASQMGSQQFSQGAQKASAQDTINQFNAMNRMNVNQRNVGEKQRIAEQGTATRNQEQMFNKNLQQQDFENQMRKAGGLSQASTNMAQMQGSMAAQQSAANQATMGSLIGAGATYAGAKSDERVKENIQPADFKKVKSQLNELLEKIEPFMYDYKNPKQDGEGRRLGVMAQDLEKSEMGRDMVQEDNNGTKNIDLNKVASAALAASSELLNRVEQLEKKLK